MKNPSGRLKYVMYVMNHDEKHRFCHHGHHSNHIHHRSTPITTLLMPQPQVQQMTH